MIFLHHFDKILFYIDLEIVCEDQARYRKLCPSFASDCKTDPKMKLACPKTCGVCKNGKSAMFE